MKMMQRHINGVRLGRMLGGGWMGDVGSRRVRFERYERGHYRWFAVDWWTKEFITRGRTLTECFARVERKS